MQTNFPLYTICMAKCHQQNFTVTTRALRGSDLMAQQARQYLENYFARQYYLKWCSHGRVVDENNKPITHHDYVNRRIREYNHLSVEQLITRILKIGTEMSTQPFNGQLLWTKVSQVDYIGNVREWEMKNGPVIQPENNDDGIVCPYYNRYTIITVNGIILQRRLFKRRKQSLIDAVNSGDLLMVRSLLDAHRKRFMEKPMIINQVRVWAPVSPINHAEIDELLSTFFDQCFEVENI